MHLSAKKMAECSLDAFPLKRSGRCFECEDTSVLAIMFIMLILCTVKSQYMIAGAAVILLSPSTS